MSKTILILCLAAFILAFAEGLFIPAILRTGSHKCGTVPGH
jgi:hypothetical protein